MLKLINPLMIMQSRPKFQGQNDSKSLILRRKGGW